MESVPSVEEAHMQIHKIVLHRHPYLHSVTVVYDSLHGMCMVEMSLLNVKILVNKPRL